MTAWDLIAAMLFLCFPVTISINCYCIYSLKLELENLSETARMAYIEAKYKKGAK